MKHKFVILSCLCICTMLVGIVGLLMAKTNDECLNSIYLSTISAFVGVVCLVLDDVEQKRIK